MSVTLFGPAEGPRGFWTYGTDKKTRFEIGYKVLASDRNVGPIEVKGCSGIPRPNEAYEFNSENHELAKVVDINVDRQSQFSRLWLVTVTFETTESEYFENPLLEPVEISIDEETKQETVRGVVNNDGEFEDAIKSSAGELINPQPVRDVSHFTINFVRNESIYTPITDTLRTYCNATNSDTFWGNQAGSVKMKISVKRAFKEINDTGLKFAYLVVTYKAQVNTDYGGWDLYYLDHGNYYMDGANKKFFISEDGHPFVGLLDGAGGATETPSYEGPKRVYRRAAFASLGLPANFAS